MNSAITTAPRLARGFRISAAVALLGVLGLWAATGAHLGWTQTSKVVLQYDEITGIDYPVREKTFVAGVELLAAGAAAAGVLAGAGFLASRRQRAALA